MISIKCFINSFEPAVMSSSFCNLSIRLSFADASLMKLPNVLSFIPVL